MAEEIKEYLDLDGLTEYNKKRNELFQDLTIEEVEEAFNELDESDPSYSAFYDVITKAKEANARTDEVIAQAETATTNATEATSKADEATERANKAAEKLETVNDFTTGENLIRGSRDLIQGTEVVATIGGVNFYKDGFTLHKSGGSTIATKKDNQGFTVAVMSSVVDMVSSLRSSCVYVDKLTTNSEFTISFEYKNTGATLPGGARLAYLRIFESSTALDTTVSKQVLVNQFVTKELEDGWTLAVYYWKPGISKIDAMLDFSAEITGNYSIEVRKPMMQPGRINNPVWASAPADLSLEPVNDITTIPNLLVGTKDVNLGHSNKVGSVFSDGFMIDTSTNIWSIVKRDDGFSSIKVSRDSTGTANLYSRSSYFENQGETHYTVSGKLQVDVFYRDTATFIRMVGLNESGTEIGSVAATFAQIGFDSTKIGEPQKFKYAFDVSSLSSAKYLYVDFQFPSTAIATYSVWNLAVFPGIINNPEWTSSSFDIDLVNDITTGTNLLRGTRNWTQGSTKTKHSTYFDDGFALPSGGNYSITKDDNGVSILNIHQSGQSSNSYKQCISSVFYGLKPGDVYTYSFEFMIDDVNAWDVKSLGAIRQTTLSNSIVTSPDFAKSIYDPDTKQPITVQELVSGKWYLCKGYLTCGGNQSTEYAGYLFFTLDRNGSENFKNLCVYKGRINNPEWSPSPFDIDYIQETGINLLRGSRDFTAGTKSVFTGGYADGWSFGGNWSRKTDDYGYTIITITRSGLTSDSVSTVNSSTVPCKAGDEFTFCVEFMSSKVSEITPSSIISALCYPKDSQTNVGNFEFSSLNIKAIDGEWSKLTLPMKITAQNAAYLIVRLRSQRNGDLNFRKPCLYKGHINNPEWSASPFDVAQETDLTTYHQYDIADLLTASEGWTIHRALLFVGARRIAQIFIEASSNSQITAFTTPMVCRYDSKIVPTVSTAIAASTVGSGWMNSGDFFIQFCPFRNISANGKIQILGTYILRNDYTE